MQAVSGRGKSTERFLEDISSATALVPQDHHLCDDA